MKDDYEEMQLALEENDKIKQLLETRKKELSMVEGKIEDQRKDIAGLNEKLQLLKREEEKAVAELNKETKELLTERDRYQEEIEKFTGHKKEIEDKIGDLKIECSELEGRIEKAKAVEANMLAKIERRRVELLSLDEEVDKGKKQVKEESAAELQRLEECREEMKELESRRKEASIIVAKAEEYKKSIVKMKSEKEELEKEISDRSKELEKIKIFIARLRETQSGTQKDGKKQQISF
jgi:chromosome segregation ATPase